MKYTNFFKNFSKIFFVLFCSFFSMAPVYGAEENNDINSNNFIMPAIPSMNNGIPYIPMPSSNDAASATIIDNGKNLRINNTTVPITGEPDLKKINLYKPLLSHQEDEIKRFCLNIKDPVMQNYFAVQTEKLNKLKQEIDKRIVVLEQKRKEYQEWLTKRNEFLKKAKESLVNIISKMNPEEAAQQLDKIDELSAASLLLKLKPRIASAIMNNLPVEKAAYLSQIIIDAQRVPPKHIIEANDVSATDIPKPIN